jgi:membrane protein YqaA with SNARE-associated domain
MIPALTRLGLAALLVLVTVAKTGRYIVLAWLTAQAAS